jgi:hypothetical protein
MVDQNEGLLLVCLHKYFVSIEIEMMIYKITFSGKKNCYTAKRSEICYTAKSCKLIRPTTNNRKLKQPTGFLPNATFFFMEIIPIQFCENWKTEIYLLY